MSSTTEDPRWREAAEKATAELYKLAIMRRDECEKVILDAFAALRAEHAELRIAQPLDDWHEDDGFVLWHKFPIDEPPWVGTPNCSDWPGYHTHWTKLPSPPVAGKETT